MSSAPAPQVVVALGTDHHPFSRLVTWMDTWASEHPEVSCFVQHGTAPAPRHADGAAVLPTNDLRRLLGGASVAVGHAGPGTLVDARAAGLLPIIVPRLARHGEVVDDHQVAFGDAMHQRGLAIVAHDEGALRAALDRALAEPGLVASDIAESSEEVAIRIGDLIDGMLLR